MEDTVINDDKILIYTPNFTKSTLSPLDRLESCMAGLSDEEISNNTHICFSDEYSPDRYNQALKLCEEHKFTTVIVHDVSLGVNLEHDEYDAVAQKFQSVGAELIVAL